MSDTSPEAAEIQDGIHRGMTGAERLRLTVEMSVAARELTLARLRTQHPEWSDREQKRKLLRYAFGSAPRAAALIAEGDLSFCRPRGGLLSIRSPACRCSWLTC